MKFKIVKNLTPYNFSDKNDTSRIKYLVVHYFGSLGSAYAVSEYFRRKYRGASAHYALDGKGKIYNSVLDEDIAWHCGTSNGYRHNLCRNSNSLGIELKPEKKNTSTLYATDTDWYFSNEVLDEAIAFLKYKKSQYNISDDGLLRHFDVTGKQCPNPFTITPASKASWNEFKQEVNGTNILVDTSFKPFIVRVTANALNIRKTPGGEWCGVIRDKGLYTIVEVSGNWGRLKSNQGWIHLGYTIKR